MAENLLKELIETIKQKPSTNSQTHSAVVSRVDEEGTVWVYIAGSDSETPTASAAAEVKGGDAVNVEWRNNRLYIAGNYSNPSAGTYRVANVENAAATANNLAEQASRSAVVAQDAAERAVADAATAHEAADEAQASAISANNSANNALTQLSVVEDVAGTLNWISEHGSFELTEDTTVQSGTVYFIYQGGDYVPIAQPDPSANPSEEGWYILDVTDSQASYIMAHLAVTSAGLWVLPVDRNVQYDLADSGGYQLVDSDGNQIVTYSPEPNNAPGYKALFSNDSMSIYNGEGAVVARYGTTITLGEDGRPRFLVKPLGVGMLNASDDEIFEIAPSQTEDIEKTVSVATYQTDSQVIATSYTKPDTSTSTSAPPTVELSIDGGEWYEFTTGVSAVATQGVEVTVTVTSSGVTAILDAMRYEYSVSVKNPTEDKEVFSDKTYYEKNGDTYTAVTPVGDEVPADEGWYEDGEDTVTAYHPCDMRVSYMAVADVVSAVMKIKGAGDPVQVINEVWTSQKKTDTFYRAKNNVTGTSVGFGVGGDGVNHGVWSSTKNSWLIYGSNDDYIRIPKTALIGSPSVYSSTTDATRVAAGQVRLSRNGSDCFVEICNGNYTARYMINQSGNKGIYDTDKNKWIIYSPSSGGTVIPQNLKCSGYYRQDGTSVYRKYVYGGVTRFGFGSGAETMRFVTKYTDANNQGWSFLIGNGGYAVGSANNVISTANSSMYLSGGTDSTARYLRSYTVYARIFSSSSYSPNMYVHTDGTLGRVASSSIRYKHDVEYLTNEDKATIDEEKKLTKKRLLKGTESDDLSSILDIPVVKFKFNEGYITGDKDYDYEKPVVGLIADDVAKIAPDVATYIEDDKGEKIPEAWNADQLLVRMLYVVQQQEKRIQELEERVKALEGGAYGK